MEGNGNPTTDNNNNKKLRRSLSSSIESNPTILLGDKKVLMILTGGTAGMKLDAQGSLHPVSGYLNQCIQNQLLRNSSTSYSHPNVTVEEFDVQLDSADMGPEEWKQIGQYIFDRYSLYHGFVVVMGTDTMAYCASALAFMFDWLNKTIVITGAMLPIERGDSDAPRNLMVSITVAAASSIPEVVLVFESFVYRGCRTKKMDSSAMSAFASPNFPALGRSHGELSVNRNLVLLPSPGQEVIFYPNMDTNIVALRLIPGFHNQLELVDKVSGLKGLVLELFGAGNAPKSRTLIDNVSRAVQRGVIVCICSQCVKGSVDLMVYENGRQLLDAGAISAGDMTFEACVTKLAHLLAVCAGNPQEIKKRMVQSLRGEISTSSLREARFSDFSVVKDVEHLN